MKILLAVDGSDHSFDAVRAVGTLRPPEQLVIVNVMNPPHLSYPTLGPNLDKDLSISVQEAFKEEGERILERASSLLPPRHGLVSTRLEEGRPAEVLLKIAEEIQANLIVMGARGLGQIREHVLGSVSHRVMTHAQCSTLIVKAPLRKLANVLVPVEGPEDARVLCEFLAQNPFRAIEQVTVTHVVPFSEPVWPVGAMIPEAFRKEMMVHAEGMTQDVVNQFTKQGYRAKGSAIMGIPSHSIVEEAENSEADLVVMRSENRTGVSRFFLGSISHSVLHHVHCSVLLVR